MAADMASLRITQVRSTIGARWNQRESLRTLGLRRIRDSVVREDTPSTRGLIAAAQHLVEVAPVTGDSASAGSKPKGRGKK